MENAELAKIAIKELERRLEKLTEYEAAMDRCAQLLDHAGRYHWMLPHSDEFDRLLLEHIQWAEKQRLVGALPAAKTIKRPVSKPKARKPRRKPAKVKHDAHYRSGGLHK